MASEIFKAIPTMCRGLQFRSRLEAAWYCYLQDLGFTVTYEPEPLHAGTIKDGDELQDLGVWLPDFYLKEVNCYVEIKALRDTYDKHDQDSMARAYVIGYSTPTIIVLGSPFEYYAVLIEERHKGNPAGWVIEFMNSSEPSLYHVGHWQGDCYPDEDLLWWADPRSNMCSSNDEPFKAEGPYRDRACKAWNETQWNR